MTYNKPGHLTHDDVEGLVMGHGLDLSVEWGAGSWTATEYPSVHYRIWPPHGMQIADDVRCVIERNRHTDLVTMLWLINYWSGSTCPDTSAWVWDDWDQLCARIARGMGSLDRWGVSDDFYTLDAFKGVAK